MGSGSLTHPTEDELVLHHWGEDDGPEVARHLQDCADCRAALAALRRDLQAVPVPDPPHRGEDYGRHVWLRLQPRLAAEARARRVGRLRPFRARRPSSRLFVPLAVAAALVLAFLVGRHWPHPAPPAAISQAARERILLVAVGDHLERSEMLLVELVNAGGGDKPVDISSERQWAQELVGANRLYRQTAMRAGEPGVASVLDELERVLVEVAHRPSSLSAGELGQIQHRIESRGLLFHVRVIETQVREKEKEGTQTPVPGGKVVS